jgi:opacity protein-like surface antigen
MKNSFLLKVLALLFAVQIFASGQTQSTIFNQASWELNLTGSLGSISSTSEYSYSSSYYNFGGSDSESRSYFQFGIIPAYYLIDGLAIEPEINILTVEKAKPSYLLIGNLAYTLKVGSDRVFPFIRAGYGITNSLQIPVNGDLSRMSDNMDIGVLNLGAGVKTLLTENILLRTEINYRKFSYSSGDDFYSYSMDVSSVALVFGFSVLL